MGIVNESINASSVAIPDSLPGVNRFTDYLSGADVFVQLSRKDGHVVEAGRLEDLSISLEVQEERTDQLGS